MTQESLRKFAGLNLRTNFVAITYNGQEYKLDSINLSGHTVEATNCRTREIETIQFKDIETCDPTETLRIMKEWNKETPGVW